MFAILANIVRTPARTGAMIATPARSRILEATRSLVRRRGYAVVSLRQVAAAAGYSPAGLYAHFAGREAILDALADEVRTELAAALERAVEAQAEPVAQLVSLGEAYVAFALEHPAEFELLFRYTRTRKRSMSDPTPSSFDLLRRIVRRGAPVAGADEIDAACLGLWATAHGLANLRTFHLQDAGGEWEAWTRVILRRQAETALCQVP
jgi:AcrR family transcriptional regulator